MKSYKIDGKIVKLPEKLEEVTVKQLIDIHNLGELTGNVSDIIKLINVFSDNPVDITTIDLGSILEISVLLSAVLFENTKIEAANCFVLNDVEYHCLDPEDLLVREFIDFQEVSKDPVSNLPLLLAIVYQYDNEDVPTDDTEYIDYLLKKKELFMSLDAKTAQSCLVFFSKHFMDYVLSTLESLETTPEQKEKILEIVKQMRASTDLVGK